MLKKLTFISSLSLCLVCFFAYAEKAISYQFVLSAQTVTPPIPLPNVPAAPAPTVPPPNISAPTASVSATTTKYVWKQFEIEYPTSWKKEVDSDEEDTQILRLVSKSTTPLMLLLTILPNAPAPDKTYLEAPALAALAHAYPVATQAAGTKDNITVSYNEVQLGDGPAAATLLTLPTGKGKKFVSTHAFTSVRNGAMVLGIILTIGQEGLVIEEPGYHKAVAEVYAMLRSIRIKKAN